eukprot:TRINITY_DN66655_c5_g7_i3.p1 TRINITY_DN66655_c5_g7~~TRINITY_DN66655_c5_g7_i3.p1  ORF type:complete len:308 (-),score=5.55 TRINITY_DN66655_c5_g7_i3:136-1059(-)
MSLLFRLSLLTLMSIINVHCSVGARYLSCRVSLLVWKPRQNTPANKACGPTPSDPTETPEIYSFRITPEDNTGKSQCVHVAGYNFSAQPDCSMQSNVDHCGPYSGWFSFPNATCDFRALPNNTIRPAWLYVSGPTPIETPLCSGSLTWQRPYIIHEGPHDCPNKTVSTVVNVKNVPPYACFEAGTLTWAFNGDCSAIKGGRICSNRMTPMPPGVCYIVTEDGRYFVGNANKCYLPIGTDKSIVSKDPKLTNCTSNSAQVCSKCEHYHPPSPPSQPPTPPPPTSGAATKSATSPVLVAGLLVLGWFLI